MNLDELEKEIDRLEEALLAAETMKQWDTLVHQYNALCIKLCYMTGKIPAIDYTKSEYII